MEESSQYSNSSKNPLRIALEKKTQIKLGSFLALVTEDASGGNHFRTLFFRIELCQCLISRFLDLLNEDQPDKNRMRTATSLLLLLNTVTGLKLISSRCSIFYFLQPSVSAWVRDAAAVALFSSKDGDIHIYCIHVESDRSPEVFSQISEQSPGSISCVTQPSSPAQGLAWEHFLETSLWTN